MHADLKSGRLALELWRAYEGPAIGQTKAVFGRNWFYFFPRFGWRDWKLHAGRMRCAYVRWLSFCLEITLTEKTEYEGNVTSILKH